MSHPNTFCENCGAALVPAARFCESCGKPAGGTVAAVPQPGAAARDCPKCGKSDQSFSAAEFCAKEFSEADEEAAERADKLGPAYAQVALEKPEKPAPPSLTLWLIVPFIPVVNFIACWFAPMHKGYKFLMLGIVIVFWMCVFMPELQASGAYAFVGCFFVLFYYAALFIDRDRQKAKYTTRLLPEYQRALPRWEHLRYCQRCEAVWLDNEPGKCAGIDRTAEMIES